MLYQFYRELIHLRKSLPALKEPDASILEVTAEEAHDCLQVVRRYQQDEVFLIFNFEMQPLRERISRPPGDWRLVLDSADSKWMGPGGATDWSEGQPIHPKSFRVYQHS